MTIAAPFRNTRVLFKFVNGKEVVVYNEELWLRLSGRCQVMDIACYSEYVEVITCCNTVQIYDGDAVILRSMLEDTRLSSAKQL